MNIHKLLAGLIVLGICLGARSANADEHFANLMVEEHRLLQLIAEQEKAGGPYSTALYQPLRDLGELLDASGRHTEAIESYRRMQHLVHRHYGVLDEKQIESVDFIINSYAQMGDFHAVDTQQHYRYHVAQKAYSDPDPDMTAARLKIADWYRTSGRFSQALKWYEESLEHADELGPDAQIRILRSEAMTQFLANKCCASETLLEALEVASNNPDASADISQSLNDFLNMLAIERKRIESDLLRVDEPPQYLGLARQKDVLELMVMNTHRDLERKSILVFGERDPGEPGVATVGYPIAMCGTTLNKLTRNLPTELDIELTVSDKGRPKNIEITGDVPIKLKRYLTESLKRSMFRSATDENGSRVSATLSFTQSFAVHDESVTSHDDVSSWSQMLVSQACQVQGLQRI
jgi:hypothetical protein